MNAWRLFRRTVSNTPKARDHLEFEQGHDRVTPKTHADFGTHRPIARVLTALSQVLLTPRSLRHEVIFGLLAVSIATGLRLSLDDLLPPGFPFLTFFPAVMLSLVFASIRCGIVVAVVCGLIAWFWFIAPQGGFGLSSGALLALGFYVLIVSTDILFITAAVWALRALSAARKDAAQQAHARELMFSEQQHRISNNLGTVAALLRLQAAETSDPEARRALGASQSRISLISRLQRRLHAPDIQSLDAADYLSDVLAEALDVAAETRQIKLDCRMAPLQVSHDAAIPLGLIASELLMNAVEHGAEGNAPLRITATLTAGPIDDDGTRSAVLELHDNGSGLPQDFSLQRSESLGLTISQQFATMLQGELSMESHPMGGTCARLTFRVARPDPGSPPGPKGAAELDEQLPA